MTTPFYSAVFAAERGGDAHGGGLSLRGMAGEHAGRAVSKTEAGDAEARDAGEEAGLALIDGGIFLGAVDEGQFFFERHLAEEFVDAGVSGDDGNGLCEREGRAKCGCGERGSDADEVFLLTSEIHNLPPEWTCAARGCSDWRSKIASQQTIALTGPAPTASKCTAWGDATVF